MAASAGAVAAAGAVRRALAGRMETVARACHELRGPLTAARLGLERGVTNGELTPGRLRAIDLELGRAALVLEDLDSAGRTRRAGWRGARAGRHRATRDRLRRGSGGAGCGCARCRGARFLVGRMRAAVWGDRLRLAQVIGNLIANAIEHGGGVVEVHGHGATGREHAIEVTDSGPGLPAPVAELVRRPQPVAGAEGAGWPSRPRSQASRAAGWQRRRRARGAAGRGAAGEPGERAVVGAVMSGNGASPGAGGHGRPRGPA